MNFDEFWLTAGAGQSPAQALGMTKEDYDALPESTKKFRLDSYLKGREFAPCRICETYTYWVEINFNCHLCSEECDSIQWDEYYEACNTSDHRELDEKDW